jgi:hypothetical protein
VQAVIAFADVRKLGGLAKALKDVDTTRFSTIIYWGKTDAAAVEVRRNLVKTLLAALGALQYAVADYSKLAVCRRMC